MTSTTIKQALRMASHALAGTDTVQVDAELLLSCAVDKPRSHLYFLAGAPAEPVRAFLFRVSA